MHSVVFLDKHGLNCVIQKLGKSLNTQRYVDTFWSSPDGSEQDKYVRIRNRDGKFYLEDGSLVDTFYPAEVEGMVSMGSLRITELRYQHDIVVKIIQQTNQSSGTDSGSMYILESKSSCHELLKGTHHMRATKSAYDFLLGR